jgi:putative ATP-grasp target RiPP
LDVSGWRLCPDRQIAVTPNGSPEIMDMTMKTTGPSPDGGGSTGGEEWGPDHHHDDGIPA